MRRLVAFAAFLLALSLIPVSAQRGGGRAGFGGRGGFGGHAGSMGHFGGHGFGGSHFSGFKFGGGGGFHGGFHHHCWGCRNRFFFPGFVGWGYYPLWWDSSSSYDYDQDREQEILVANQMNALNLEEQSLREREEWMREREEQDAYARQSQPRTETPTKPEPATVLVFRDQHQQEITNYAISGSTLWVLTDHVMTKKIPLSDLDLTATAKANEERGVEFQIPK
jgi:hypothetical protein